MEIRQLAETVLFSSDLSDKVRGVDFNTLSDKNPGFAISIPRNGPERPPGLGIERSPRKKDQSQKNCLEQDRQRGLALHAFANHELLAAELMALMLLRFPESPSSFRRGVAQTLLDEQRHLSMYWDRMTELGVEFGEIPLNGYFWRTMSQAHSPFEFISQMSLTFEQANLDFALYFAEQMSTVGDDKTHKLLNQVYQDEIQHVAHGLKWFRKWKTPSLSDWEAFCGALPYPMTAARAKGRIFDIKGRKKAGFSDEFISQLQVFSSSKGRTPSIWHFNPEAELHWQSSQPTGTSPKWLRKLQTDAAPLLSLLAKRDDIILTTEPPTPQLIQTLRSLGASSVEYCAANNATINDVLKERPISKIESWGLTAQNHKLAHQLNNLKKVTADEEIQIARSLNDKTFLPGILYDWQSQKLSHSGSDLLIDLCDLPTLVTTSEFPKDTLKDWIERFGSVVIKERFGSNGRSQKRYEEVAKIETDWKLRCKIEESLKIVVEPWVQRILDVSSLLHVTETCIQQIALTPFLTSQGGQYYGSFIHRNPMGAFHSVLPTELKQGSQNILDLLWDSSMHVARKAQEMGYRGPLGIDHLLYVCPSQKRIRLRPVVDINARFSMGRIAAELAKSMSSCEIGFWFCLTPKILRALSSSQEQTLQMLAEHPKVNLTCDIKKARQMFTGILRSKNLDTLLQNFPFVDKLREC